MKRKPAKSSREERVNFLYITKHEECCVSESISRERESDLERREKGWERPLVTTYRRTDLNERPGQGRVLCGWLPGGRTPDKSPEMVGAQSCGECHAGQTTAHSATPKIPGEQ